MLNRFDREEQNRESLHASWMQDTYNPTTKENSVPFTDYAFSKYTEYCEKQFGIGDTEIAPAITQWIPQQIVPVKIYIDGGRVSHVEWIDSYEIVDVDKLRDETFLDLWDEFVFTKDMARHNIESLFEYIWEKCEVIEYSTEEIKLKIWDSDVRIETKIIIKHLPVDFLISKQANKWS